MRTFDQVFVPTLIPEQWLNKWCHAALFWSDGVRIRRCLPRCLSQLFAPSSAWICSITPGTRGLGEGLTQQEMVDSVLGHSHSCRCWCCFFSLKSGCLDTVHIIEGPQIDRWPGRPLAPLSPPSTLLHPVTTCSESNTVTVWRTCQHGEFNTERRSRCV